MLGPFAAVLARIVVAIDINLAAFLSAELTDACVAPVIIWSSAVNVDVPVPANVGAVKCVDDDGGITKAVVNASAPKIRIRAEVAEVNEGVTFRTDIAGGIYP
jgi:hypothetical protein